MKLASRRAIVRITANFLPVFRLLRGAKRMQTVDYVCGGSTTSQRGQVIGLIGLRTRCAVPTQSHAPLYTR
jgi:hypothetical protein